MQVPYPAPGPVSHLSKPLRSKQNTKTSQKIDLKSFDVSSVGPTVGGIEVPRWRNVTSSGTLVRPWQKGTTGPLSPVVRRGECAHVCQLAQQVDTWCTQ
jgi:hypothetical protein